MPYFDKDDYQNKRYKKLMEQDDEYKKMLRDWESMRNKIIFRMYQEDINTTKIPRTFEEFQMLQLRSGAPYEETTREYYLEQKELYEQSRFEEEMKNLKF